MQTDENLGHLFTATVTVMSCGPLAEANQCAQAFMAPLGTIMVAILLVTAAGEEARASPPPPVLCQLSTNTTTQTVEVVVAPLSIILRCS